MIGKTSRRIQHDLALYYNVSEVNIIEVIDIPSILEDLAIVLEIEKETFLLVIVYACSSWFFLRLLLLNCQRNAGF